jgi:hypothetical protein
MTRYYLMFLAFAMAQNAFNYGVTVTPVATVQTVVVRANQNRKGMRIWNNSSNSVYLSAGLTCNSSTTLFAIVPTFQSFELTNVNYMGPVCAIRNSGSGNVVVTEFW